MEGKTLSHFRIASKIGQGGMGVVYKAEDVNLGRTVAIKLLPADLVGDPKRRARFVTEARTAAAVTHPNIATIYEIDSADGTTFIAMEYLEGETLRERLASQPMSPKQAIQLGAEIAEGLSAAHRANIVHRDLKPDNVMITRDGHAKILDFGLARLLEPPQAADGSEATMLQSAALTDPNAIMGTPAYMSPEQARGLEIDFRSDIFSFGCTFYEMLTGQRPFRGRTSTDTISDILTKTPIPATSLNAQLPSSIQWVLDKCLDKEADERYRDTRDLVVDLHHVQRENQSLTSGSIATGAQALPTGSTVPPGSAAAGAPSGARTPPPMQPPESATSLPPPAQTMTSGVTNSGIEASGRKHLVRMAIAVGVTAAVVLGLSRLFVGAPAPEYEMEANSLAIFAFENLKESSDPERYGQIFQDVLITALSGLDPLKVYSGQRLFDIQKQLSNRSDGAFDREFNTEVARSAGAEHMLTGSLGQLGDKWILNCQMVQVASGTVVFSKRIDGVDLYEVADVLTSELQNDLRITAPTEISQKISVREKTSSSLDAYRVYLDGTDLLNTNKFQEAAEQFREAIKIDPDFGQAYYKLALAVSWPGDKPDEAKALYDDFLSNERYTSDKEKRIAQAARARLDNQFDEILPEQLALVEDYPDEKEVWYELGETLFHFPGGGKDDEALEAFERALVLDPDFLLPYQHIFDAYWRDQRFDDAVARAESLIRRDPDNPTWHRFRAAALAFTTEASGIDAVVNAALEHQKTPEDRRELYKTVATHLWAQAPAKQEEYYKKALAADPDHDDPTIVTALTNQLRNRARWDEYEKWVRDELERDPNNSVPQQRLLDVYQQTRRYNAALEFVKQRAQQTPDDAAWARRWARAAIRTGDGKAIQEALPAAERAAQSTDDQRRLYVSLGQAYHDIGRSNLALEYLGKASHVSSDTPYAFLYNMEGFLQHERGRYAAAEQAWETALELNPNDIGACTGLIRVAADRGDNEAVNAAVDRTLKLLPPGRFGLLGAAGEHLRAGRLDEARTLYEEYVSSPAPDWRSLNDLVQIAGTYLMADYVDEALALFQRAAALEVSQRKPDALNGVGVCQLALGDYAEAERTFRRALTVEYPDETTRTRLAVALLLQEQYDRAEETLAEEEAIRPHRVIDLTRAALRATQKRYGEARALAEQCVAMDSSRVSHELLAWALIAGNLDVDRGIREAERALALSFPKTDVILHLPCFPPAEHSLGLAALAKGDADAALAHLRRAEERTPNSAVLQADLRRVESMVSGTP